MSAVNRKWTSQLIRGGSVTYSPDRVVVEGKLAVEEKKDDGYVIGIFQVAATSISAAKK